MSLDESTRERVALVGGKVAGVDCPNCAFESREIDLQANQTTGVTCPDCGREVLSAEQVSQLRRAGKL